MDKYNQLINDYKKSLKQTNKILAELKAEKDGFTYLTKLHINGGCQIQFHNNHFSVNKLDKQYYGDNGILTIYTDNPNHKFANKSDGAVVIMTTQEIKNMGQFRLIYS